MPLVGAAEKLRGEVLERASWLVGIRVVGVERTDAISHARITVNEASQAEIAELQHATIVVTDLNKTVFELDITVDESDVFVDVSDGRSELESILPCEVMLQAHLAVVAKLADEVVQRPALNQVHDAEGGKVCDETRVQSDDVRVVHVTPYTDLILDSLLCLVILCFGSVANRLADDLDCQLGAGAVFRHANDLLDDAEAA